MVTFRFRFWHFAYTILTFGLVLQIVQLGVALSEVEDGSQRIILYYTDAETQTGTRVAASFKMGDLTGRWARFTLTVQGSEVSEIRSVGLDKDKMCAS